MSTVTETWPTTHPPVDDTISGDQTWTLVTNPGVGWAVSAGHAAIQLGDEATTATGWARCDTALATADHEAQIAIGPISSDGAGAMEVGVAVRFDPSTNACYLGFADLINSTVVIYKADSAGALTALNAATLACALNDVLKLRATGTSTVSLTLFVNGASQVTASDSTSPLSNLRTGIMVRTGRFNDATPLGVHSFTATDVSTGTNYTLSVDTLSISVVLDSVTLTYTPASGSGAYVFGAANSDHLTATVTGATHWTIAARFSLAAVDTSVRVVGAVSDGTLNTAALFFAGGTNEARLKFSYGGSGATERQVTWVSGFSANVIHTLIGTFNGTTLALYADTDATPKATLGATDTPDVLTTLVMGNAVGGSISLAGTLYELAWYEGTALTAAQAAALGGGGQMAFGFPQPTHYYPFNGNANDLFGAANGTVTGATQTADAATSWFPVAPGGTSISTIGRGSWRGTWRGTYRGS